MLRCFWGLAAQPTMPEIRKYLSLVALAPDRERLASDLVAAVDKRGCEIMECRIGPLGAHVAAALLISGNWSALGKFESALPGLAEQLGLLIHSAHTEAAPEAADHRPYAAEVVAPQQSRLLGELVQFFGAQEVRVTEVSAQAYDSAYTGAAMCSVHLNLQVPLNQHPQTLRESFMDLCDDLHADGMLDPIKS